MTAATQFVSYSVHFDQQAGQTAENSAFKFPIENNLATPPHQPPPKLDKGGGDERVALGEEPEAADDLTPGIGGEWTEGMFTNFALVSALDWAFTHFCRAEWGKSAYRADRAQRGQRRSGEGKGIE